MNEYQSIQVTWDDNLSRWTLRAVYADGAVRVEPVGVHASVPITDAIDQACWELDCDLTHEHFGIESDGLESKGLFASWQRDLTS